MLSGELLTAFITLGIAIVAGLAWLFKMWGDVKGLKTQYDDLKEKVKENDTLVRDVTTQLAVIETKLANTDEKLDIIHNELGKIRELIINNQKD
jgi:predicted nuclease with TOPRIM domain